MLFTTTTQYVALAVALIAGWLFGLASHPGGRKWKERYADEREVHTANRRDFDARLAESNARISELETENARLARAAPASVTTNARAATAAEPAYSERTGGRGWFNWRNRAATDA